MQNSWGTPPSMHHNGYADGPSFRDMLPPPPQPPHQYPDGQYTSRPLQQDTAHYQQGSSPVSYQNQTPPTAHHLAQGPYPQYSSQPPQYDSYNHQGPPGFHHQGQTPPSVPQLPHGPCQLYPPRPPHNTGNHHQGPPPVSNPPPLHYQPPPSTTHQSYGQHPPRPPHHNTANHQVPPPVTHLQQPLQRNQTPTATHPPLRPYPSRPPHEDASISQQGLPPDSHPLPPRQKDQTTSSAFTTNSNEFSPTSLTKGGKKRKDLTPVTKRKAMDERNIYNRVLSEVIKKHGLKSMLQRNTLKNVLDQIKEKFPTLNLTEESTVKKIRKDIKNRLYHENKKLDKTPKQSKSSRQLFNGGIEDDLVLEAGTVVDLLYDSLKVAKAIITSYPCAKEDFPDDQRENFVTVMILKTTRNSKLVVKEIDFERRSWDKLGKGYSTVWPVTNMLGSSVQKSNPCIIRQNGQYIQGKPNRTKRKVPNMSQPEHVSRVGDQPEKAGSDDDVADDESDVGSDVEEANVGDSVTVNESDVAIDSEAENVGDNANADIQAADVESNPHVAHFVEEELIRYGDICPENSDNFDTYIRVFSRSETGEQNVCSTSEMEDRQDMVPHENTEDPEILELPSLAKPKPRTNTRKKKSELIDSRREMRLQLYPVDAPQKKKQKANSRSKCVGDFVKVRIFAIYGKKKSEKIYYGQIKEIKSKEVFIRFLLPVGVNSWNFPEKEEDASWVDDNQIIEIIEDACIKKDRYGRYLF